jgi:hypothetical protein
MTQRVILDIDEQTADHIAAVPTIDEYVQASNITYSAPGASGRIDLRELLLKLHRIIRAQLKPPERVYLARPGQGMLEHLVERHPEAKQLRYYGHRLTEMTREELMAVIAAHRKGRAMTFEDACKLLGERFRTSRPRRSELAAAHSFFLAHGKDVNTSSLRDSRNAMNTIWDHWYSHVEFRRYGTEYRCVDIKQGVYGSVEGVDDDTAYRAYLDLEQNPKPLPFPEQDFDWRSACLRILDAVGNAEGVWFQDEWRMDADTIDKIKNEYNRWVEQGGPSVPPEGA